MNVKSLARMAAIPVLLTLAIFAGAIFSSTRAAPSPLKLKAEKQSRRDRAFLEAQALSLALPDDPEVLIRLALAALDARQTAVALEAASGAVRRAPASFRAQLVLGRALTAGNRVEEGLARLREAVKLSPQSAEAHLQLGSALLQQHDYTAAETSFREATRLAARDPAAMIGLMNARSELNAPASELVQLGKTAIAGDPSYAAAYPALARVYMTSDSTPDRAIEVLERGLEVDPAHSPTHHMVALALLHYSSERPALERAEAEAAAAIALDPEAPAAYLTLGRARIKLGRASEALSPLFRSLSISPTPEAIFVISEAYARSGRAVDAARWRAHYAGYSAFEDRRGQLTIRIARQPKDPSAYFALAEE